MKEIIRENIRAPYSLHDMNIIAFEAEGDHLTLRTQSGMCKTTRPYGQPQGHVEFSGVQWDFSWVYLLDHAGNAGTFTGEKMELQEFIRRFGTFGFCVMDEAYGYNSTKYSGYLTANRRFYECMVEIYHEEDMIFVDETEYSGMAEVILSHDSEAVLYSVPAEVAGDLERYCLEFAGSWVWNGPENYKFLKPTRSGQLGARFGAEDFIDYLNRWEFPDRPSGKVRGLGCWDYEIPEEYKDRPQFNF